MPNAPGISRQGIGNALIALSALSPRTAPIAIQQLEGRRQERIDATERERARKQLAQDRIQTMALQGLQSGRLSFDDIPDGVFTDPRMLDMARSIKPERSSIASVITQGGRRIGIDKFGDTVKDLGLADVETLLVNRGDAGAELIDRRTGESIRKWDAVSRKRGSGSGSTTSLMRNAEGYAAAKTKLAQDPNNPALQAQVEALEAQLRIGEKHRRNTGGPSSKNGGLSVKDERDSAGTFRLMNAAIENGNTLLQVVQGDPGVVGITGQGRAVGGALAHVWERLRGAEPGSSALAEAVNTPAVQEYRSAATMMLGNLKKLVSGENAARLSNMDTELVEKAIAALNVWTDVPSVMQAVGDVMDMAKRNRDISADVLNTGSLQAVLGSGGSVDVILPVDILPDDRNLIGILSQQTGKSPSDVMQDMRATMSETGLPWRDVVDALRKMSAQERVRAFSPDS